MTLLSLSLCTHAIICGRHGTKSTSAAMMWSTLQRQKAGKETQQLKEAVPRYSLLELLRFFARLLPLQCGPHHCGTCTFCTMATTDNGVRTEREREQGHGWVVGAGQSE